MHEFTAWRLLLMFVLAACTNTDNGATFSSACTIDGCSAGFEPNGDSSACVGEFVGAKRCMFLKYSSKGNISNIPHHIRQFSPLALSLLLSHIPGYCIYCFHSDHVLCTRVVTGITVESHDMMWRGMCTSHHIT